MIIRNNIDKELHKLLLKALDYYGNFAFAIEIRLKNDKMKMSVVKYLEDNPDAKTDDILDFVDDLSACFGLLRK